MNNQYEDNIQVYSFDNNDRDITKFFKKAKLSKPSYLHKNLIA
jgi:hypothetical protein